MVEAPEPIPARGFVDAADIEFTLIDAELIVSEFAAMEDERHCRRGESQVRAHSAQTSTHYPYDSVTLRSLSTGCQVLSYRGSADAASVETAFSSSSVATATVGLAVAACGSIISASLR